MKLGKRRIVGERRPLCFDVHVNWRRGNYFMGRFFDVRYGSREFYHILGTLVERLK